MSNYAISWAGKKVVGAFPNGDFKGTVLCERAPGKTPDMTECEVRSAQNGMVLRKPKRELELAE
jgi:hypothetical protein